MAKTSDSFLTELEPIFREILDCEDLVLTEESSATDIEEWDSLAHIQLIMAIGKHFGLRFTTQEMASWKTVGDIINTIRTRQV